MNMQVSSFLNRTLEVMSNSLLNSQPKTTLQPDTQASHQDTGVNGISFGTPATSHFPELSAALQNKSNTTESASFTDFMQSLHKLLQTALSAIQQQHKTQGTENPLSSSPAVGSQTAQSVTAAHPDSASSVVSKTPAPTTNQADAVDATSASNSSQAVNSDTDIDPGSNSLTFENKGNKPMTITFTPNADGSTKPDDLTLLPGETKMQKLDANWSGNFRSTQGDGANATLGEVKFDGSSGQTWYDVSYIEGNNAAMTIGPAKGDGRVSGTLDDLVSNAPESIKARDANDNVYGLKKSTTANQQDPAVVDYYRQHVTADKGYVIPSDDASTLSSSSKNLKVELKG